MNSKILFNIEMSIRQSLAIREAEDSKVRFLKHLYEAMDILERLDDGHIEEMDRIRPFLKKFREDMRKE